MKEDKPKPYEMLKLSTDFVIHCKHDLAKKCLLVPKIILQGLCVWPDSSHGAIKKWTVIAVLISLFILEVGHVVFIGQNMTNISKMASGSTTASTTMETFCKLATLLFFREPLNRILVIIWHDFWPAKIASQSRQKEIKSRSSYVTIVGCTFLTMAYISCAQFMAFPLISTTNMQLPLESWFPFNYKISPLYEMLYIWQWFMNQVVICVLSGFDMFFNAIVMICACQFQILQGVMESMCEPPGKMAWSELFEQTDKRNIKQIDVMIKCVKHHLHLINLCKLIESSFTHIVFLQFVFSTLAICVSCVALVADPSLLEHMFSYFVAHLLQFFIYCSVGNELTYQSGMLADATYMCNWESSYDRDFRMGLRMIIQRAQKPEALTVAGLMQLSFANFLATVQLSFSFYTMLTTFV